MRATIWGCRGSLATPGADTVRVGGNTSSIELRTASERLVVLDAGTGIRRLGYSLGDAPASIDLVLTHLHLDHVEGLGFFAPLFMPGCEITIWGPHETGSSLAERIAAWLSPPYFPRRFDEIPARIRFVEVNGGGPFEIGELTITPGRVCHPGDTLGYRIEEAGRVFTFIPDNELGLEPESGLALAEGSDLLFHDAQYTEEEYKTRVGWGHTDLPHLPAFLDAAAPGQAVMFHHDPSHSDEQLEQMRDTAQELAGRALALGSEGETYEV